MNFNGSELWIMGKIVVGIYWFFDFIINGLEGFKLFVIVDEGSLCSRERFNIEY